MFIRWRQRLHLSLIAIVFSTSVRMCSSWSLIPSSCVSLIVNGALSRAPASTSLQTLYREARRSQLSNLHACAPVETDVTTPSLSKLEIPGARKGDCWRPTADDVDRISWGRPAKKKMTGSRGVPHRLNQDERMLYDMARRKGFLEMAGSGWRKQRRGAPLANTYRSWCDSQGVPVITLHKDKAGQDEVALDLSPMRIPEQFPGMATQLAAAEAGATIESFEGLIVNPGNEDTQSRAAADFYGEGEGLVMSQDVAEDILAGFEGEPIYRLPMYVLSWVLPRGDAKALAKRLADKFHTMEPATKGKNPSKTLKRGMPQIKPGKSRRHGGYGIG